MQNQAVHRSLRSCEKIVHTPTWQAKPRVPSLQVQHLPWWRRRFRLRAAIFSRLLTIGQHWVRDLTGQTFVILVGRRTRVPIQYHPSWIGINWKRYVLFLPAVGCGTSCALFARNSQLALSWSLGWPVKCDMKVAAIEKSMRTARGHVRGPATISRVRGGPARRGYRRASGRSNKREFHFHAACKPVCVTGSRFHS